MLYATADVFDDDSLASELLEAGGHEDHVFIIISFFYQMASLKISGSSPGES